MSGTEPITGKKILTGCGHAGIINTIDYSKKVTGIVLQQMNIGKFSPRRNIFVLIVQIIILNQ
jgi:hypothetical protein